MRHLISRRTPRRLAHASRLLTLVLLALLATVALTAAGTGRAGAAPPIPGPPVPGPPLPSPSPSDGTGDNPGLFDIPGQIRKAINDFISWVAQTGLKPVLDALGHTVLSTPDVTGNAQVQAVWTTCLVAANAVFVLFVIAGGFIVAARDTLQSRYGLKEIAPRIVVAGVLANASLLICGKAITFTNALTEAIAGQGVDGNSAGTAIQQILTQPDGSNLPPILFSLLVLAALVMAIVVVITFILRAAMLVLLIGMAPLPLMCHATPQTEGLAYTWWRALVACLSIQLGQALIILATVRVFLTPAGPEVSGIPATTSGLLGVLVCLTMLWLLIKLPGWMRYLILGRLGQGRGLVGQILHAYLQLKMLGALVGTRSGTSRSGHGTGTGTNGTGTSGTGTGTISSPKPSPTRPGSGTARPGGPGRGRPSRSPRSRPSPAPAGPAAFSNAPATHTPLSVPGGTATAPGFSHTPQPSPSRPGPHGPGPAAGFSHAPAAQAASPQLGTNPGAARFSNASAQAAPRRATGAASAPGFSSAPGPQAAPRRPPTPATPVFSSPSPSSFPSGRSGRSVPPPPSRATPSPSPSRSSFPSGGSGRSVPPSPSRAAPSRSVPPSPSRSVPPSASGRSRPSRPRSGGGDQ